APELPEDIGKGKDESERKGNRKAHHELTGQLGVLEFDLQFLKAESWDMNPFSQSAEGPVRNEFGTGGTQYDIMEDPVNIEEGENGTEAYGYQGANDMPSKFFDVIYEGHLPLSIPLPLLQE